MEISKFQMKMMQHQCCSTRKGVRGVAHPLICQSVRFRVNYGLKYAASKGFVSFRPYTSRNVATALNILFSISCMILHGGKNWWPNDEALNAQHFLFSSNVMLHYTKNAAHGN